jgi:hypothetical protein
LSDLDSATLHRMPASGLIELIVAGVAAAQSPPIARAR